MWTPLYEIFHGYRKFSTVSFEYEYSFVKGYYTRAHIWSNRIDFKYSRVENCCCLRRKDEKSARRVKTFRRKVGKVVRWRRLNIGPSVSRKEDKKVTVCTERKRIPLRSFCNWRRGLGRPRWEWPFRQIHLDYSAKLLSPLRVFTRH